MNTCYLHWIITDLQQSVAWWFYLFGKPVREWSNGFTRTQSCFFGASWTALAVGTITYLLGLWNAQLALSEKGYYLVLLLFGLFAAVSLQKAVRDRLEQIPVTEIYLGICWFGLISSIVLLAVGLWNATMPGTEKGFYGMGYLLSLFAAVAVQKNVRDTLQFRNENGIDSATHAGSFLQRRFGKDEE